MLAVWVTFIHLSPTPVFVLVFSFFTTCILLMILGTTTISNFLKVSNDDVFATKMCCKNSHKSLGGCEMQRTAVPPITGTSQENSTASCMRGSAEHDSQFRHISGAAPSLKGVDYRFLVPKMLTSPSVLTKQCGSTRYGR